MDEDIAAAVRLRFPIEAEAIVERASWDPVFCEICRDFAEAQTELVKWEASSDPHGGKRCAEYRQLIAELAKEIEDALAKAKVVKLHHPPVQRSR
ncbi:hypothetical protein PDO_5089 [Rhizobium sp. PDO1-076]|uniref:hypothetical protein n=1 Tax=Rhizobium sp. PDO1-076 TaxID=1125979 RepID=UPI00024E2D12|nr:hypothetical protein [Rhizobium sp. PDO1-076]EHS51689.1 hypothetical protein PDO_5089 [Rhizobium sp. PDO1-076]